MSTLAMSLRQARFELKAFFRNPAAAFFTFIFPLMFLVIFNMVFGDTSIDAPGGQGKIDVSTFYVPAITAVSVIGACYINMAMGIAFASTLAADESFTTVELKINFFRPIWRAELKAEATVVQHGRTVGYVECNITDEQNRLIARSTSTCIVLRGERASGR